MQNPHTKQVNKTHYDFFKYSHTDRWVSYYHQLHEVLKLDPESVLEVGVGDKVFGSFLMNNTKINYTSVDIAEDLDPDVVGSVISLPFENNSFDMVCAFEVLEHLTYENFLKSLSEMSRVSRKCVIISLPHFGPRLQLYMKLPLVPELRLSYKVPYHKRHEFNGEHYWEIGKKGSSLSKVKRDIKKYFKISKEFVPFESQYHHFFVLEKK
jgi:ubiquinone/menaquinone biosynthesis C-methylase UbiE